MASTTPELGAWMAVPIMPSAPAMRCPLSTVSPAATQGCASVRADRRSGRYRRVGSGAGRIAAEDDSVLCEAGLTPPRKLKSCIMKPVAA